MLDYHARFYDPYINRWIQPDSIIPDPANPQSFNRYSYVGGNPLKFVDPTGHFLQCVNGVCEDDGYSVSNPSFTSYDSNERRQELVRYNNLLWEWAQNGWITDLEGFAQLCNYAASMIPTDIGGNRTRVFVNDVASVLTEALGRTYYGPAKDLQQTGFDWAFQDPGRGGNQPHHFWFYVYRVFNGGRFFTAMGNFAHETFLTRNLIGPAVGRSYQDFALGQEAINMACDLRDGYLDIGSVGNYVLHNLGTGGAAVHNYHGTVAGEITKRAYAWSLAVSAATLWPIPQGEQGGPANYWWPLIISKQR